MQIIRSIGLIEASTAVDRIVGQAGLDDDKPITAAVANAWGQLIRLDMMDGAMPTSVQTALDKLYTAYMLGRATLSLEERVISDPSYRQKVQADPRFCFWAGAVPVTSTAGKILGWVSVSGRRSRLPEDTEASPENPYQDHELALVGSEAAAALVG